MENIKIKVCAYARFSSTNQRVESIDTQLKTIREYCERNSLEIVATYTDEAKTATNDDREGFLRMIEDSKKGEWEAIVLYSLDRFSRNAVNHYRYKEILDNYGVRIIAILDGIEGADTAETGLMENIKIGLAEYYSAHLSKVILDSCIMTSRNSLKVGGLDNLGFTTVDQKYYINEKEADIVRTIFDMFINNQSINSIVEYLKNNNYKTKLGNNFSHASIMYILQNRKYDGQMVYNMYKRKSKLTSRVQHKVLKPENEHVVIKDALPRIVDHEKFEKAQEMINRNTSLRIQYGKDTSYLLTGLIFCSLCGGKYHHEITKSGKKKSLRNIYRCSRSNKRKEEKCRGKSINAHYLENYVIKMFDGILLNENAINNIKTVTNDKLKQLHRNKEIELQNLKDELSELDKEIDRLTLVSTQSSGLARESIMRVVNDKNIDRNNLIDKIVKLEDFSDDNKKVIFTDIPKIVNEYLTARKEMDILEMRRIIMMFLRGIYMSDNKIEFVLDLRAFTKNISNELIDKHIVERSIIAMNKFNFKKEIN